MATVYKNLLSNDVANTRTLLHEAIPITGSIVSGTYGYAATAIGSERNIKTYGHGMFESVYDYPYLSSSANQIFDITTGYAATSGLSGSSNTQNAKKINIYNQMAQYLVGYDHTGSIKKFKMPDNNTEMLECYFVPFSRLLTKDEIKKGSFTFEVGVSGSAEAAAKKIFIQDGLLNYFGDRIKITDTSGSTGYHVDSPAGEYGVLYATQSLVSVPAPAGLMRANTALPVGLLYYQAGVMVLSASIFQRAGTPNTGLLNNTTFPDYSAANTADMPRVTIAGDTSTVGFEAASTGSTIGNLADGLRNRIYNISFNNTTELNSTIYFCRASHSDFNYSSNPTYLTGSQIRVKTRAADTPVAYFTSVGLYSADNELLAVAKLSEPLRKDPTNEVTLRVRLDY